MLKQILYEANQLAIFIEHAYIRICQKVFYMWIKLNDLNQQLIDRLDKMDDSKSNYA